MVTIRQHKQKQIDINNQIQIKIENLTIYRLREKVIVWDKVANKW